LRQQGHISNVETAAQRSHRARGGRLQALVALCGLVLALVLSMSAEASAAPVLNFKEAFGSGAHPQLIVPTGLAVDQSTGDVLVMDQAAGTISRFKPDGTAADFSALGTNVIDGDSGADQTPQGKAGEAGLTFAGDAESEIAVDNSGAATGGDIYVTQSSPNAIDIFASSGEYLGQLTESASGPFSEACGVTADSAGSVFVGDYTGNLGGTIDEFSSTVNPVTDGDSVTSFHEPFNPCVLVAGAEASKGSLFALGYFGSLFKLNASSGAVAYTVSEGQGTTAAVDPATGDVLEAKGSEIVEYDVSGSTSAVQTTSFEAESAIQGLAVGPAGIVYLDRSGSNELEVLRHVVIAAVTSKVATAVGQNGATLHGTVNPEGLEVTECKFEYGPASGSTFEGSVPCNPSAASLGEDTTTHSVSAVVAGLEPNTAYHFRLAASDVNGTVKAKTLTFTTSGLPLVTDSSPTGVSQNGATLHGTVNPEGLEVTECKFEYGPASGSAFESSVPCNPPASSFEADTVAHSVSAALTGLEPNIAYHFRLTASNHSGTRTGEVLTFTTSGPPQITEVRASDADQSSVTLEAHINPGGLATSYRFEWGTTTAYGHNVPAEFDPVLAAGDEPVAVTARVSGLAPATELHYRLSAANSAGTKASPDQLAETLDSCDLPDRRCFEQVSPLDPGPVAAPGEGQAQTELQYQAGTEPGKVAYLITPGLSDATKGAEDLYLGSRTTSGWVTSQLSAPISVRPEGSDLASTLLGISDNLTCGFETSTQPLTSDPGPLSVQEAGGSVLFRYNPDGSYTAVPNLPPERLTEETSYVLAGFSQDCGKVVFRSRAHYPGVPAAEIPFQHEQLYEWDEGMLRSVGHVPSAGGEKEVAAIPGGSESTSFIAKENFMNSVSEDGSRVFFTAERRQSANAEEVGAVGLFVREDGLSTRDVSMSETSTPDTLAYFEDAAPDGSRVFFTAPAGLTSEGSSEGRDLYEYDLEKSPSEHPLKDLTVDHGGSPEITGVIGVSDDGSHVYFVAQAQLVEGQGKTLAENQSDRTYSVYGETGGVLSYAGTMTEADLRQAIPEISGVGSVSDRVSRDGRYLMYESKADVTGYHSGGVPEIYIFDSAAPSEPIVCASCRPDGRPPITPENNLPLINEPNEDPLHPLQYLTDSGGEPRVFFVSFDDLASGAVEGEESLYEFVHGQIFHIATQVAGLKRVEPEGSFGNFIRFIGASEDGTDLYFRTARSLLPQDKDERSTVYDARIGGGFPEASPPVSCDPNTEGSCQGTVPSSPGIQPVGSATFSGPGNPLTQAPSIPAGTSPKATAPSKPVVHHKKKKKKKKKRRKSKHKQAKRARHAISTRKESK
jgi:hypothetical protein